MRAARPRAYFATIVSYEEQWDREARTLRHVPPAESGLVHAVWEREDLQPRTPQRRDRWDGLALCGAVVRMSLPLRFPPEDPDACPQCVAAVAAGVRLSPERQSWEECEAVVAPAMAGYPAALACSRRRKHSGPHRAEDGSTWERGTEDFTPGGDYRAR